MTTIDFTPGGGACPKCVRTTSVYCPPDAVLRYVTVSVLANGAMVVGDVLMRHHRVARLSCTCRSCGYRWFMRTADDPENG